jgi:hypothetical protein
MELKTAIKKANRNSQVNPKKEVSFDEKELVVTSESNSKENRFESKYQHCNLVMTIQKQVDLL